MAADVVGTHPDRSAPSQVRWGRGDALLLLAFSAAFLAAGLLSAHRKILWGDELVTYYVSTLPSARDVWAAIVGGDVLPPLGHFLTRASIAWLGPTHVAIRLPEVIGYWVMSLCIYLVVRRYTSTAAAGVALLVPACTAAYVFSYEARPYGLMLGSGAAVLLCWQRAAERTNRAGWLIGVSLSVAAAVSSHWYAILVMVPIGLGELVRLRRRGRLDVPMLAAIAVGMAPLIAFLPIIRTGRSVQHLTAPTWTLRSEFGAVVTAYQILLEGSGPLFGAILLMLAWFGRGTTARGETSERLHVPPEVLAALMGFLLIPIAGVILAAAAIGEFNVRYVLLTIVGIGCAVGIGTAQLGARRRGAASALLAAAVVASLGHAVQAKIALRERSAIAERSGMFAILGCSIALEDSSEPIVVTDIHSYDILNYYAPPTLASRLVYLTEYNAMASAVARRLKPQRASRTMEYKEFTDQTPSFLLYESQYSTNQIASPLLPRLIVDGHRISNSGCIDARDIYPRPGQLYRVTSPRALPVASDRQSAAEK
jgi:Dolichyl-phosphate-mannose-protein mannosyltransferase